MYLFGTSMSKRGDDQRKFARDVGLLLTYIYSRGYAVTFGDAWAKTGHSPRSFHYIRLAIDLNLFKYGNRLQETEYHEEFGGYWKSLDPENTWGGDFERKDGSHFSRGER